MRKKSWKGPALMAVVLPGGLVIAAAWLMSRYLGERGAPSAPGEQPRAGRARGRWSWPQSRSQGGWDWPRASARAGRWDWPSAGSHGAAPRSSPDDGSAS